MTFDDIPDIDMELFQTGIHRVLRGMLDAAQRDDTDYRRVIRILGNELRKSGVWRGEIKRAAGWDGHATAWAALQAYIKEHRTDDPWWSILEYADGAPVPWFGEGKF